ncbi:MAG: ATP-binding cassette domain-containing protein [Bryobacterales bacterium]|jgi:osmoprotectant transport system ATP-binding protein|nr:ATP-binding cassette domain-containing protein [Bryobacterales bacterium]
MAVQREPAASPRVTPAVEFRNVSYTAGDTPVLRGVTLAVQPGETLVLLGRSGSGKTTALKLINALLMPASGEVRVAGQSTTAWDPVRLRRRTGYVIQETGLFPHWTVAANVGTVPRLEGWPPDRIAARTRELLTLLHLPPDEYAGRFPHQLSGGQRQRVGVARALAADPDLLLFDEPFGALDPVTRTEVQREFRTLVASLGKAAVFVTHDVREALLLATRIGLLRNGALELVETPGNFRASSHPEARAFLECLQ